MSGFPIVVDGSAIRALIVGGGAVATRKAIALLAAGATVRVVAPVVTQDLADCARRDERLDITLARYDPSQMAAATYVVAATNDPSVNSTIACDARSRGCLVNVVDAPHLGTCTNPAVHRAGPVLVAVSAGGVPGVATRIRDGIASRIDVRYADAVEQIRGLRRDLLARGDRDAWASAMRELVADDFCESVESGAFATRLEAWR